VKTTITLTHKKLPSPFRLPPLREVSYTVTASNGTVVTGKFRVQTYDDTVFLEGDPDTLVQLTPRKQVRLHHLLHAVKWGYNLGGSVEPSVVTKFLVDGVDYTERVEVDRNWLNRARGQFCWARFEDETPLSLFVLAQLN